MTSFHARRPVRKEAGECAGDGRCRLHSKYACFFYYSFGIAIDKCFVELLLPFIYSCCNKLNIDRAMSDSCCWILNG